MSQDMPGDEELGNKSMEARKCSRELGKPGTKETHKRTNTINNELSWLLGAAGAATRLPVPIGTPLF